jgi:hypothetical protein
VESDRWRHRHTNAASRVADLAAHWLSRRMQPGMR